MKVTPCLSARPSLAEISTVLSQAVAVSAFVDFRYENQRPAATSPSAVAARADTLFVGSPDQVKSWLGRVGGASVVACKNGATILRCRSMNRRAKYEGASCAYYENKGAYMWRAYRLEGIKLHTLECVVGGKRIRLFPNVAAPVV